MFEKPRMFFTVLQALVRDPNLFQDVRTIAYETRENRIRIEELKAEVQEMSALDQQLFQELRSLRQELNEVREFSEQERQKILLRLEQIEHGLPPLGSEEEAVSRWIM